MAVHLDSRCFELASTTPPVGVRPSELPFEFGESAMKSPGLLVMFVLAVAFTVAPQDGASQVRAMDLDDLVRESTHVIRARVVDQSTSWTENALGKIIVSDFRLQVSEVLKGEVADDAMLQCFGGKVGEMTMTSSEEARVGLGEEVVLFVVESPFAENRLRCVGGFQGKYQVVGDRVREMRGVTYESFRADIVRRVR